MKKLLLVLFLPLILIFTETLKASCHEEENASKKTDTKISPNTKAISVSGMTCKSCIRHVEKELQAIKLLPGLKFRVELNLITLDYNENKSITPAEIETVLNEAKTILTKNKYQILETKG
jgi:copper chaperone CopZ